jgi:alkyl-hydroperoxide reductase/thiol specific antioxidant family protein
LRQRRRELEPARVVVITFASASIASRALRPWLTSFEVWVDPQREAYRAWGLGSRSLFALMNAGIIRVYVRAFVRGKRWRPWQWDFQQLGGDAVLDPKGVVRLWHPEYTADDRPSVDTLIRALHQG